MRWLGEWIVRAQGKCLRFDDILSYWEHIYEQTWKEEAARSERTSNWQSLPSSTLRQSLPSSTLRKQQAGERSALILCAVKILCFAIWIVSWNFWAVENLKTLCKEKVVLIWQSLPCKEFRVICSVITRKGIQISEKIEYCDQTFEQLRRWARTISR